MLRFLAFRLQSPATRGPPALPGHEVHVSIGLDIDAPAEEQRRLALHVLQQIVEETRESDLQVLSPMQEETPAIDLRIVKSAHRLVQEVARRGERGRVVLAADLVSDGGLSAPTIGRLLREGNAGAEYLRRYVVVRPHGRTKALDLTPEGRLLASRIRAGAVPV